MSSKHDKLVIADEMLVAAIIEYLDHGRYFASLNLAAIAEELYGKYVRVKGLQDAQHQLIVEANKISHDQGVTVITVKDWKKTSVFYKNSIKHFDSEADRFVEMNPENEARLTISDALTNHKLLNRQSSTTIQRFCEFAERWVIQHQGFSSACTTTP